MAHKLFIVGLLWETSYLLWEMTVFSSVYCGAQAVYCGFIVGNKLFIVDLLWEMTVFSSVYCGAQAIYCGLGSKMTFSPIFYRKSR